LSEEAALSNLTTGEHRANLTYFIDEIGAVVNETIIPCVSQLNYKEVDIHIRNHSVFGLNPFITDGSLDREYVMQVNLVKHLTIVFDLEIYLTKINKQQ